MKNHIKRPLDNYSPAWPEYWKQNPSIHRSVGAAGDDDDDKKKQQELDLKEIETLKETVKTMGASIAALEEKNRELIAEKGQAKSEAQKAADEAARKNGDIEALEKSYQTKMEAGFKERDDKIAARDATISELTSGSTAKTLAADIALPGSAEVLMPHIKSRLQTELNDDGPIIRVLDKDGKPSAMSVDDLKKEISEDKAFAPLIVGSNASGGGNLGDKAKAGGKTVSRETFNGMSQSERKTFATDGGKVVD